MACSRCRVMPSIEEFTDEVVNDSHFDRRIPVDTQFIQKIKFL